MATVDPSTVNPMDCTAVSAECPVEASIYGYYPSMAANAFFVAVFAICLVANVYFGIRYKTWTYMTAMTLACFAAALGYAGRVLLNDNPFSEVGFNIQICCLTISPAFNSAAIYLILKHIVRQFGREFSRLRPKYYTWGFISADFVALVLQGTGGGLAATSDDNESQLELGDNMMIAGITMQVVTLLVFGALTSDFLIRRFLISGKNVPLTADAEAARSDRKFQIFAVSMLVIYFTILIRCVYRIAEMAGGWRNDIMQDEGLFIGLDSTLVGIATLLQTFVHPGFCFKAFTDKNAGKSAKGEKVGQTGSDESMVEV